MIISEFLPNPIGKDAEGEWIELFNDSENAVNLNGWQIKDASGKTFFFKNKIDPGEYLVFDYKTTKISLNNNTETLFLYDPKGNLIDKAEFVGAAPEGKSLIRQNSQFIFTDEPTPGAANKLSRQGEAKMTPNQFPQNESIIPNTFTEAQNNQLNKNINLTNLFIGLFLALVLAFVFTFIVKKLNLLSE
jgi:hypothetical protein